MKNIQLIDYYKLLVPELEDIEFVDLEDFSYTFYIITKSKKIIGLKVDPKNPLKFEVVLESQLSEDECPDILDDTVLDMKYILELESLVIVTKNGLVIKFQVNNKEAEPVAMLDGGVLGAQWSPNQEQLVIATGTSNLVSISTEFDILNEVPIDEENNQVLPDQPVYISWKNDAKNFMTNYALEGGRKALTRDSELNMFRSAAKSDPDGGFVVSVAEKAISQLKGEHQWQPNANFIAGWDRQLIKDSDNKYSTRVIFWEKNGLRHLEFLLPSFNEEFQLKDESDLEVFNIRYNRDSDILSLFVRDSKQKEYILLYHRSNYKWFLKKVLESDQNKRIAQTFWCNSSICRLFVIYVSGEIEVFDWSLAHFQNSQDTYLQDNISLAVNIDNNQVGVSSFSNNIVPPPMSNINLITSQYVESVVFGGQFVFVVTGKSFELYQIGKKLELKKLSCKNEILGNFDRIRSVLFDSRDNVLVGVRGNGEIFQINFKIEENVLSVQSHKFVKFQQNNEQIISSCGSSQYFRMFKNMQEEYNGHCYFSTTEGKIYEYTYSNQNLDKLMTSFPLPVIKMVATEINEYQKFVGISQTQRLVNDNKIVCPECTSFIVFKNFLVFTAKSQQMYEIMYTLDFKDPKCALNDFDANIYPKLPKQNSGEDFIVRNIERGCKIVGITNQLKLVLQAQRGNLEGIYPRVLMLKKVKELIGKNKYLRAFEICRTNKLDLNLIFDIDAKKFQEKYGEILEQIASTDYINIFVQSLTNNISPELQYCVTESELKEATQYHNVNINRPGQNKINTICDLIISDLEKKDELYMYCVMSTYIKKDPPQLNKVLSIIKEMKDREQEADEQEEVIPPHLNKETNKKFAPSRKVTARKLLEFVCWLADSSKMYEVALLTYDLDLVAMVAEFTQRDPKEYLKYFEKIRAIPDVVEQKYTICLDLKHYAQAIEELSKGNEEQVLRSIKLIKEHNQYKTGMEVFKNNSKVLKEIKNLLGDHLSEEKEYAQAILAYESAQNYKQALQQAQISYNFLKVLQFSKCLKMSKEERTKMFNEQIEIAKDNTQYQYVANIYFKLKNYEKAIEYFVKTEDWKEVTEALNLLPEEQYDNTLNNVIQPAIELSANIKGNQIKKYISDFSSKSIRLKEVQLDKKNSPSLMTQMKQLGGGQLGGKDFDQESDISEHSQITTSSRTSYTYSQTTGVKRRKDKNRKSLVNRKIAEGSPLEEEYLVAVLRDIQQNQAIYTECKQLIQYLISFNCVQSGEYLNTLMQELEKNTNKRVTTVQQEIFEEMHPEIKQVYPHITEFEKTKVYEVHLNNFDYMYNTGPKPKKEEKKLSKQQRILQQKKMAQERKESEDKK